MGPDGQPSGDPTSEPCCDCCACFGPLVPGLLPGANDTQPVDEFGTCRRGPPQMLVVGRTFLPRVWPMPHKDDWCACHMPEISK